MAGVSANRRSVHRLASLPFAVGRALRQHRQLKAKIAELEQLRKQEQAAAWKNAKRYALAYRRILAALSDQRPKELGVAPVQTPPLEETMAAREFAREVRAKSLLFDLLQSGEPLEAAVAAAVRRRLSRDDHLAGRALAHSLLANPSTEVAGHLGSALVAAHAQLPELAWHSLRQLPAETWRRYAAAEYFTAGFRIEPDAAAAAARALITERPAVLPPAGWVSTVQAAIGAGQERLAADVFAIAEELAAAEPEQWAATTEDRDWLRPWFDRMTVRPEPAPVPTGHVKLGVFDYKQPDRRQTSSNLGDYVQTLACLANVVRHQGLRFHGDPELAALVTELQQRVKPELRLDTEATDVTLVPIHRDASSYDPVPEDTFVVAFGWYMQSVFGRHDFPFHPNLRPIFVSFHCNRPAMLTPETIDYLREYGPVGCRDWSTVDLLLSAGVPAFFSGCLTTTVDAVFPAPEQPTTGAGPVAYVDAPGEGGVQFAHERGDVRNAGLEPNLRAASDLLLTYRDEYARVITSRLHCYLPCRSIGVDVTFNPKNPADPRFDGLQGLSDKEFGDLQQGIREKLVAVLTRVFAGDSPADVYASWREVCEPEVELARSRRATVPALPPPSFDLRAACDQVRKHEVTVARSAPAPAGEEVHVALALDGNLKNEMRVVVEGLVSHCSRPLRLWVLCRDHDDSDYRLLADLFPEVTFSWLPCDDIDYGPIAGMLKHITVSTMDRLLLPDLLPELERIIYHDIDALPVADVAELYDWPLEGHPLAARSAVAAHVRSGHANVRRSAKRLSDDPATAADLLRRSLARNDFDYLAFNAGILVFDLRQMRADNFCHDFIPYVERYGMNDQEVLNCYAGPRRAVLPAQWNSLPTQEVVNDPRIIHWAGPLKPWKREYVLYRELWQDAVERLGRRGRTLDQ